MLKTEEIAKRLEAARRPKAWAEDRIERLKDLDESVRKVGHLLMGRNESGKESADNEQSWMRHGKAMEKLAQLGEADLLALGDRMFPKFRDVFRKAWELRARVPVQLGYSRKPFRAPHDAELLLTPRRQFLGNLVQALQAIDEDLPWIAAHGGHLGYGGDTNVGLLLAAAIELGGARGAEASQILRDSAAGTHEVGQFGRHVVAGLLIPSDPSGWEFMTKMLLAAQRQEGLRQTILESIDFAHPDAFRRMLRTIDEEGLVRFSSVVRAVDVWFGLQLDSISGKYVEERLHLVAELLDDESARARALGGADAEKAFYALWSLAFEDMTSAIGPATKLLKHDNVETRYAALFLLSMLELPSSVYDAVRPVVDDVDPRIAAYAASIAMNLLRTQMRWAPRESEDTPATSFSYRSRLFLPPKVSGDLFERLEKLHARLPEKPKPSKPLIWPWAVIKPERGAVADAMIYALGDRPTGRLLPYLPGMTPAGRQWTAQLLGHTSPMDAATRSALLELVGDPAGAVREAAVKSARKMKVTSADLQALEPLLSRKASDLRRGIQSLILSLDEDAQVFASIDRLLASKDLPQRLAALDLLTQLRSSGRGGDRVAEIARQFNADHPTPTRDEQVYLEQLLAGQQEQVSLSDALGLMDNAKRTPPTPPKSRGVRLCTPATAAMLRSLDDLIHAHRDVPVKVKNYAGDTEEQLLGSFTWGFPAPRKFDRGRRGELTPKEELPLHEVWFAWWADRAADQRDADGLEGVRAEYVAGFINHLASDRLGPSLKKALDELFDTKPPKLRYPQLLSTLIDWLTEHHTASPKAAAGFAVDAAETVMAAIPKEELKRKSEWGAVVFRDFIRNFGSFDAPRRLATESGAWSVEHARRWFGLLRWVDEPAADVSRGRPDLKEELLPAFEAGVANQHDLLDALLGNRDEQYGSRHFGEIATASTSLRRGELSPAAADVVQRAIDRVLEIELRRGENETAATGPALQLNYAGHIDVLVRVLRAIGSDPKLQRTYTWGEASKGKMPVFSRLIRVTFPAKDETPQRFVSAIHEAGIAEDTLLAVAFYAPQWARFIEAAVGWPLFEEAVWWFHAHTKDKQWRVDQDTRESWNASIRALTSLSLEDLMEGAVDVDWFHRVHEALGKKRWDRLSEFAKYASGGGGHLRATLFAEAMLGQASRKTQVQDITKKRKQDAVRALGLIPIDKKNPRKDVLDRYKVMQEFVRTSRKFGSMRQASEKLAARIGQENLARTAGYPDPVRLQWAMEGLSTADLAKGPVTVKVKDISVTLAIEADGQPEVTVKRDDKPLKAIPPEARKNADVQELTQRKTDLRRSASRMRQSLELAMCRGDRFTAAELVELMQNAVLRPMLERLVFVNDAADGKSLLAGYPVDGGAALRDEAGKAKKLPADMTLRLAHPSDLLRGKRWTAWQHDCFAAERVQPFKQIFRELYVPTEQERADNTFSRRYAGQQVNPRQALALLGGRGWVTAPEAGVFRMFPEEKLVAWIEFMETFYTPAEIEGLTLEKVRFARRGSYDHVPLGEVPPRIFSESMRDVDLVVSVAHRGAVDPEASASTVELRSSLLRETLQLLKQVNVKVEGSHAKVRGTLGEYSVHLGSGTTHMLPGGALFIVPVHSQHRGRLFLPFADEDPKTAEVISKVLLLARDQEIRDPNLLGQIRAAAGGV